MNSYKLEKLDNHQKDEIIKEAKIEEEHIKELMRKGASQKEHHQLGMISHALHSFEKVLRRTKK